VAKTEFLKAPIPHTRFSGVVIGQTITGVNTILIEDEVPRCGRRTWMPLECISDYFSIVSRILAILVQECQRVLEGNRSLLPTRKTYWDRVDELAIWSKGFAHPLSRTKLS
jgi:hypothetical protein